MPLVVETSLLATSTPAARAPPAAVCRCSARCACWHPMRATRCCRTVPSCRPSACWAVCPACRSARGSRSDGDVEGFDTPGKVAGHEVGDGSIVVIRSAGGGGYGDPAAARCRPGCARTSRKAMSRPKRRAQSLRRGARCQGRRRCKRHRGTSAGACAARVSRLAAVVVEDSYEVGAVSRRRICRLHPKDATAAGLQADDLVEIDARHAAPLRAWVRIDPAIPPARYRSTDWA